MRYPSKKEVLDYLYRVNFTEEGFRYEVYAPKTGKVHIVSHELYQSYNEANKELSKKKKELNDLAEQFLSD